MVYAVHGKPLAIYDTAPPPSGGKACDSPPERGRVRSGSETSTGRTSHRCNNSQIDPNIRRPHHNQYDVGL